MTHNDPHNTKRESHLSPLPSLLGTNQRNNPRQFTRLAELLPLHLVLYILAFRYLLANLQHPVLQCEELAERVIEERGRECDVGG